jgi:hypothetical protein
VQGKVIEFWRAVEMFSPPSIPAARPSEQVFDVRPGQPLPWNAGHPLRREPLKKNLTWRHTVYVGIYSCDKVFQALRSVFPPAPDSFEERPTGSSALLAFAVSDEGTLLEGSVVLSACAWATARAHNPGPKAAGWLDGFGDLEAEFALRLEEMFLGWEEGVRRPPRVLDWDGLVECEATAGAALGAAELLEAEGIRVNSTIVGKQKAEVVEHDFLNSFIADDLARVAGAVAKGDVGRALGGYLKPGSEIDTDDRVDVRVRLEELRSATDPDRIPLGRWPAAPEHPLALGQQVAVDEAVAMRGTDSSLFAVNGPPGTGKTTMLRDLIAALVTERAERLAALPFPSDAFVGEPLGWKTSRFERVVHRLRPELTGFELVLASSNNGAVENVTLEIPSIEAIDPAWREQAKGIDYFPALAERAMGLGKPGGGKASHPAEQPAWALIAARLGKSENRKGFVNAIWWSKPQKNTDEPPPPTGLRDLLVTWSTRPEGPSWADAVAAFEQARDREAAIREERRRTRAELERLGDLESEFAVAGEAEKAAGERVAASRPRREQLEGALQSDEGERERRIQAREEMRRSRPWILRLRARAEWRAHDRELAADVAAVDARLRETREELQRLEEEARVHAEAAAELAAAESRLEDCRRALSLYREQPGAQLPDGEWLRDRQARERQAPWTDVEWNQARTELFGAALALHRAFLVHAARPMRESLDGAMEILSGNAPPDLSAEAALAAWQALFLAVPVVSTTFASVSRLFGPLGRESLGWLLVDEAGQSAPQSAVGALWRSRRAVIVGDPLQLEPITTIPFEAEQAIRSHYGVGEEWLTGRSSVQSLADRLNRLGTSLPGPERSVWVGAPLSVHRRCDRPMFDLSNAIAYDGLMLDATDPTLAETFAKRYPTLPQSKWIDVRSETSNGHWIPAEGAEVDRILAHLDAIGFDFSQVMAIAPFRDVSRRLTERARQHAGLRAGTIHTAQGKEAEIVILVLGSDPAREGARAWAASRPNLLNVAVSRAKRRLYVIGDREAWMRQRYFDLLAEHLPHDRPRS